ncbi:MAG: uracil-DNA glycosylase [Bryobacteraceae bacterium]
MHTPLQLLQQRIVHCELCPRLRDHCRAVAQTKRRAYRDWTYWGRPVPSFGDPQARVHVLGLAPGAHGANRTGRMFTGDSSGDFLYAALHATGFASQPDATHKDDGLQLHGLYISASAHCAPPDNKPLPEELRRCRPYLEREIDLLPDVRVVVALGRIAFDTYLGILKDRGLIASRAPFVFGHGALHRTADNMPVLISCYHPSQQNTSTGRLTQDMLRAVFRRARELSLVNK